MEIQRTKYPPPRYLRFGVNGASTLEHLKRNLLMLYLAASNKILYINNTVLIKERKKNNSSCMTTPLAGTHTFEPEDLCMHVPHTRKQT